MIDHESGKTIEVWHQQRDNGRWHWAWYVLRPDQERRFPSDFGRFAGMPYTGEKYGWAMTKKGALRAARRACKRLGLQGEPPVLISADDC